MVLKAAELEVNQPNRVSNHRSLHWPMTPTASLAGLQAGTESKGAGVREEVSLVRDQQQCQMSGLPFALWTKHHQAAARLCWAGSWGSAPVAPCLLPGWARAKATGELGAVQAAKQFLLYKARPVTCLPPYTLPGVTPGLCRSAEVQAQQQL